MKPFSIELLTILCLASSIWSAVTCLTLIIIGLVYLCRKCSKRKTFDDDESRDVSPINSNRHSIQHPPTPSDRFSLQTMTIPDEPTNYIQDERREKRKTTSNSFRFAPRFGPVERETPYPVDIIRRDRLMKNYYRANDHV